MKKFLALLLTLVMCLCCFAACGDKGGDNTGNNGGDNTGGNTGDNTGGNTGGEEDESVADKLDNLVKSFWSGDTMYEETVLMVAETDASGNVVSAPKAKLMFDATEIVSVKQYNISAKVPEKTHASTAYSYKDGYLTAAGEITDGEDGKKVFTGDLPYVNDKAVSGEEAFPGVPANNMIPSTDAGLYLPFTEGAGIIKKQLYVTYKHPAATTGVMPAYEGAALAKTIKKLKKQEPLELFIYGDSISTGANSSGYLQMEPGLKPWFNLVKDNLEACYGGKITLKNLSVGGWTSNNGVEGGTVNKVQAGLAAQFKNKLKDYYPDLAVIGYGMNDATLNVGIEKFKQNIKSMIDTIRKQNPDCDIILLGTMLANPKAKDQCKNQAEYSDSLADVAKGYKGIAVVNVGKVHKAILDTGKIYTEMSANNVNHPNDFTTRMYASAILSALVK